MEDLNALERDTIAEVGNISLGSSATALSVILNRAVDITTPNLTVIDSADIKQKYPIPCLLVEVDYISGLEGSNVLLIKEKDAMIIASLMMGEDPGEKEGPLSEIEQSAVQEAMNQMMGSMATSMSELFQRPIDISPPTVAPINLAEDEPPQVMDRQGKVVHVEFTMRVEDIIDSIMIQIIPLEFAKRMAADLLQGATEAAPEPEEADAGTGAATEADLHQAEDEPFEVVIGDSAPVAPADGTGLSELEKDTIAEVGNISLGSSATALSTLLSKVVEITTPQLEILKIKDLQQKYPLPCLLVEVDYIAGLEGSNVLLIKEKDCLVIAALMMGEDPSEKKGPLSEIEQSAVQEAMNQMMGSMATSMAELFMRPIDISPPRVKMIDLAEDEPMLYNLDPEEEVVQVEFSVRVEDLIDSVMIQIIPVSFARKMAGYLLYGESTDSPPTEVEVPSEDYSAETAATSEVAAEEKSPEIVFEPRIEEPAPPRAPEPEKPRRPEPAPPRALDRSAPPVDMQKLDMVRDIPMDITVVLGKARVPLGMLFALDKGGIVDLDCSADDPVELFANDKLLAKGEVVLVNDQLGVRITEIQFEEVIESYGI